MKRIPLVFGLFLFSIFSSCGDTNMGTTTINTDSATAASSTTTTTTTTTTTGAATPSEIETKANQAYQDARKDAKIAPKKATGKK